MTHHLVTLTDGPDALDDHDHCNVVETFAFDGEDFDVAYVECKADHDLQRLAAHDAVKDIDDSDEETDYFLQVAPEQFSAQSDGVATIDDVRSLHETPESDPEDDRQTDGENVTVCAMDSGVWPDHPVFDDAEVEQADVTGAGKGDAVGHGGAVFGQISRLAPEAALLSLRIFGDTGSTDGRTIMRAYQFAHENVGRIDVLNSSWGSSKSVRSINRVHNSLVAKGVVCVSAAGNSGSSGGSPATASRDFGVGACDEHGTLAPFSSWNPDRDNPDVLAVGVDNRLVRSDGTALGSPLSQYWTQASGTSFASPSVSGMVAKYLSPAVAPDALPQEVRQDFESSARPMDDIPNAREGAGIADYQATAEDDLEPDDPDAPQEPDQPDEPDEPGDGDEGNGNGRDGSDGSPPDFDEPGNGSPPGSDDPEQPDRPERGDNDKPPNVPSPPNNDFGTFAESIAVESSELNPIGVHQYLADITHVVDGDSIECRISYGFDLTQYWTLRLLSVDTSEIYGVPKESEEYEQGARHRQFVQDWVAAGREEYAGESDYPFVVKSEEFGKYGARRLAVVKRRSDGAILNEDLIDEFGETVRYG